MQIAQHPWQAVCAFHSAVRFCEKNRERRCFTPPPTPPPPPPNPTPPPTTPPTTPEQRSTSAAEPVSAARCRLHDLHKRVLRQGQSESPSSRGQCYHAIDS